MLAFWTLKLNNGLSFAAAGITNVHQLPAVSTRWPFKQFTLSPAHTGSATFGCRDIQSVVLLARFLDQPATLDFSIHLRAAQNRYI